MGNRYAVVLVAAVTLVVGPVPEHRVPSASAAATASVEVAPSPGTYTGQAFDACTAPSSAAMQAWLASPYRAVGIYFGGGNRACTQPNLTPAWVSEQLAAGWHLLPIYLGYQAPCTLSNKIYRIDPARAVAQAQLSADDAAAQAAALGLGPGSVLIFDMEAYQTGDAACRSAVLTFISAWTARLHDHGYYSGFYSSLSSGVADQVSMYATPTYGNPDYLDFARWDGVATTADPSIPSAYWPGRLRIKQYQGGHNETWGGVTINIDNDYVDVAPLGPTPMGDFSGNGWSDIVAKQPSTNKLFMYTGSGSGLSGVSQIGFGWNGFDVITRLGDFDRDGREDIIVRQAATGNLYLYRWVGTGFATPVLIGTNWHINQEITAVGDMTGDGNPDLLGVRISTGVLYLYPGHGTGAITAPTSLGSGWNALDELTGVGDFDRDGFVDIMARIKSSGDLVFYPGRGAGFAPRIRLGTGWNTMRSLVGVGDFDRDGFVDLVAVEKATNFLFWYRGQGSSLAPRVKIGAGWSSLSVLL